ncbi:hypothetical protein KY290_027411 [Solanum tuberosum]|uniref:RNase H type-1 domain-containing protein n=1 Tax=Solanum tuberosum TaxID=4113 RepID=A0ABQ7UGN5_SOLTU|nr:hypothetical protein KY289_026589 [Solanum tuberosum]KAH0748179.1 hypothetical protein KY290_027411 [Solanum tuberosum]
MWKARNSLCFNGGTYEPNDVVNKALFDLHEYDDVVKNSVVVNPIPNKIYDVIITLARDGVVFTDAGLQREKEKASIGMAAIDSCGYLLHAFGTPIQFVGKAITVEALPIREAVERALQKGWSKVHILSDAKNVIQMLQKNLITSWEIETICKDVWRLM